MPERQNIYFVQFTERYGDIVFLPYTVGQLWAFARTNPLVASHYRCAGLIHDREDPRKVLAGLRSPRVAALSCYVWNWEISTTVARMIKREFPSCLVVLGGPQVPDDTRSFYAEHPYVDLTVHGEGEEAFVEILTENLGRRRFGSIPGVCHHRSSGAHCAPSGRPPMRDLSRLPSPYLEGVFDGLLEQSRQFQATWETTRGCPYACAYCAWGEATHKRRRRFDRARLDAELRWFGQRQIPYVMGADANFGMQPEDLELAQGMAATRRETSYPREFRVSYARSSFATVLQVAEVLVAGELTDELGINLSVQSMEPAVLENIGRAQIDRETLAGFAETLRQRNIPVFTELVLGLPGETYASFVRGIDQLLTLGFHDSMVIYLCTVLPNSRMADEAYQKRYGIATTRTPAPFGLAACANQIVEYQQITTSTCSADLEQWRRMVILRWAINTLHGRSFTQNVAILCHESLGIDYARFYESLIRFAGDNPSTVLGTEVTRQREHLARALASETCGIDTEEYQGTVWSVEAASSHRIVRELDRFYDELEQFVTDRLLGQGPGRDDSSLAREIIGQQRDVMASSHEER